MNVALVLSGLPTSSFTFKGFPPRGPGALRNWFAEEKDLPHTLIGYESPFRIGPTLQAAYDLAAQFKDAKVKGEVAFVIAGANPKFARNV